MKQENQRIIKICERELISLLGIEIRDTESLDLIRYSDYFNELHIVLKGDKQ